MLYAMAKLAQLLKFAQKVTEWVRKLHYWLSYYQHYGGTLRVLVSAH